QQDSHGYSTSPRAMHYGVWEMPISEGLPRQSNGFLGGKWATWRRIRRAARDASTFHLVVDAPALLGGRHLEKSIEWFARRVALFRDRGMLCIETLRSMATRLADVPVSRPQRSILHAAA
ncbi:MAG TPA: hypothetical protein VHE81_14910, partial [Lacipirellulaceae bacterium]|nr:hypothetical protein [Lacipirellulaceae bacterium]